jgi:ankyrin repeat protein/ethanolamine utilization cobalamin adenosyltransferase
LKMVIRFWPNNKIRLTANVLVTLVNNIMPYIFPRYPIQNKDTTITTLEGSIKYVWKNRKKIGSKDLLEALKLKRQLFTDEDEKILTEIYVNFPFRDISINERVSKLLQSTTGYSDQIIRDVWRRRNYSKKKGRHIEFLKKSRLTPKESEILGQIYLHWPNGQKILSLKNINKISDAIEAIKVTRKEIQDAWKRKKLDPKAPDFSRWGGNRLVAAITAGNNELFTHYITEGDDVNGISSGGTPLTEAIVYGRVKMFDILIKTADVNKIVAHPENPDNPFDTPLVHACRVHNDHFILKLLEGGADPNVCAGFHDMPPLWYYLLLPKINPDIVKKLIPETAKLNRQSKESSWRESQKSILMLAAGHKNISVLPILLGVKGLKLNQSTNYGNTALHFAAYLSPDESNIKLLLDMPYIQKNIKNNLQQTPLDLADCRSGKKDTIIKYMSTNGCNKFTENVSCRLTGIGLKNTLPAVTLQVNSQTTPANSPASPMVETQICKKFSLNQGNLGICYMLSVIVLFKNEFTILHKLKELVNIEENQQLISNNLSQTSTIDTSIKELVAFLDTDYTNVDFKDACPKMPKSWEKTVVQTDTAVEQSDIEIGGDHNFLLLYIFKTLDIWHNTFNVAFDNVTITDDNILMTKTDKGGDFEYNDTENVTIKSFATTVGNFQKDKEHNIALIEVQFGKHAQIQLTVDNDNEYNPFEMVDKMARIPTVRGFIVRVSSGPKSGHVFAGKLCNDRDVIYCNSWGGGCVNSDTINMELINANPKYKITTIHFVLRK